MRIACSRAGLTFVELIVVLVIVGITSALAVPALARLQRGGAAGAAEELVAALHVTRDAAAARRAPATFTLEMATGRFWVMLDAPGGADLDTLHLGMLRHDPRVHLRGPTTGWMTVVYDPVGRARGEPVSITDGDETYDIVVDRRNGAIRTRAR